MPHFNLTQYNFSVSEFIELVNNMLQPARVVIHGEITSLDTRGRYTFFTLQDPENEARLNCFAWEWRLAQYGIQLQEGMNVKVYGYGRMYAPRASFSFEIEQLSLVGEGTLNQAYQELYKELESKGYFAPERKRALPQDLHTITLITSRESDAIHDFLTRAAQADIQVMHHNVHVEGVYAVDEISHAIRYINEQFPQCQLIVITRGGGSQESLQAFNSRPVIEAIFQSKIPVMTAIGHHEDKTIADLVSDISASTPTHAGMLIAQQWHELAHRLQSLEVEVNSKIAQKKYFLEHHMKTIMHNIGVQMESSLKTRQIYIANKVSEIKSHALLSLRQIEQQLYVQQKILLNNHPKKPLKKGYAILRDDQNKVIQSARQQFMHGSIQLQDGTILITKND